MNDTPNVTVLKQSGWTPSLVSGTYCVAWQGNREAVFVWRAGEWQAISERGAGRRAG